MLEDPVVLPSRRADGRSSQTSHKKNALFSSQALYHVALEMVVLETYVAILAILVVSHTVAQPETTLGLAPDSARIGAV